MTDDYHVGIRMEKHLQVLNDEVWGDFSEQAKEALKKGITVYSSKDIKNGTFVSSYQQALEYAGQNKKQSKF